MLDEQNEVILSTFVIVNKLYYFWNNVKRPSHGKLKLANSCWQTQVGVCERRKNSRQTRWQTVGDRYKVFAHCFCAVHTHQLEFANTNLPTLVSNVKAALGLQKISVIVTLLFNEFKDQFIKLIN